MKCTIILMGFKRFDEGTEDTIFARLKFCIFVIVQSAKCVSNNIGMNFEAKKPVSNHTTPSSKHLCDMLLKYLALAD